MLLSLQALTSKAQSDYTIEYTIISGLHSDTSGNMTYSHIYPRWLYIYADSISFFSQYKQLNPKKVKLKASESHGGILRFLKTDSAYYNMSIAFKKHYFAQLPPDGKTYNEWKILDDTLNILGYTCTKAVNKIGVAAWFAKAIPVNAGPDFYYGLPGVILQVSTDSEFPYIISAKDISKKSSPLIFPKKYAFISWDVYDDIHKQRIPKNHIKKYCWYRRF